MIYRHNNDPQMLLQNVLKQRKVHMCDLDIIYFCRTIILNAKSKATFFNMYFIIFKKYHQSMLQNLIHFQRACHFKFQRIIFTFSFRLFCRNLIFIILNWRLFVYFFIFIIIELKLFTLYYYLFVLINLKN